MPTIMNDNVEIEFDGLTYSLSKLDRHILYCVDDQRPASNKYTQEEVDASFNELRAAGLVYNDEDGHELLTGLGDTIVLMLRDRPR